MYDITCFVHLRKYKVTYFYRFLAIG